MAAGADDKLGREVWLVASVVVVVVVGVIMSILDTWASARR